MKIIYYLTCVLLLGLAAGCGKAPEPNAKEQAAIDAAFAWLALVDQGKYAESWDKSAAIFQAAVKKEGWIKSLESLHKPMGRMESRALVKHEYTTSLPNTPKGEYVVLQFKTHFADKKGAIETVTPMVDPDGQWRVSGYYIK